MSLQPRLIGEIPAETIELAKRSFPKGHMYMRLRDELESIYTDEAFADLFAVRGKPAEAPWRLAMVVVIQFLERLSDDEMIVALHDRITLKYLLGLKIGEEIFDASTLSRFRARLVEQQAEVRLLDLLLIRLKEKGFLRVRGSQRTDSTAVLAKVRGFNRLCFVGESLRAALNALATVHPDWLLEVIPEEWHDLYDRRFEEYWLPKDKEERDILAARIGRDGFLLLREIDNLVGTELNWLGSIPPVNILRQIWEQQYYELDDNAQTKWRTAADTPPAAMLIHSPYDAEARYATKRNESWAGYKVHLSETCDDDLPHLIVNVETTPATTTDMEMTIPIHQSLRKKGLLPGEEYVDQGYIGASNILELQKEEYKVDLIGPVGEKGSCWQARTEGGLTIEDFKIDWQNKTVSCPEGKESIKWVEYNVKDGADIIHVEFSRKDCAPCPLKSRCTKAQQSGREMHILSQPLYEALKLARERQKGEEFKGKYKARAGIEGTLSQGVRRYEIRKTRYIGLAKTRLQHMATAVGINLIRLDHWLCKKERSGTRQSSFAALANYA